jgi:RNA polymerase sigma-70 factor (ECF subfamily)
MAMIGASVIRRIVGHVGASTDEELVAATLDGSADAFGELTGRHRVRLERLCQRIFSDPEAARDLAQESLMRAYAALKSYRAEMPFGGWLRSIAINLCYDELRKRKRRPEELVADFSAPEAAWMGLVSEATPEQIVAEAEERREAHELAHRLLDILRPEDRMVMVMKESEEMSVGEIAEALGWSEAKVKIRAFRARSAMRKAAAGMIAMQKARAIR